MKKHFRWVVILLLFMISLLNFLDRASFGYALPLIARDFSFSSTQQGLILSAFGLGYLFATFLGGIAADRFGAKKTLSLGVVFWCITIVCLGLSNGWLMFLIFRVLFGMAEGPAYPSMSKAIANWLPDSERSRAFTYGLVAVPLSLGLGGLFVDLVITQIGWRWCFFALALITLIWLPFWLKFFTDDPKKNPYISQEELDYLQQPTHIKSHLYQHKHPWKVLLTNPTLLANYFSFFVFAFYLHFFMNWLPSYFFKAQHIEFKSLGIYILFPWLTAAIMIFIFGEWSDKLFNRYFNLRWSRTYLILFSQLLAAIFVLGIHYMPSLSGVMICMCLTVGFAMAANAPFYSVNVDIAKERAGTSIGLMCCFGSIGSILSPSVSGLILDWTGRFDAVFFFMSGLGLISCLFLWFFHNRT